jgi:hypothetical protein
LDFSLKVLLEFAARYPDNDNSTTGLLPKINDFVEKLGKLLENKKLKTQEETQLCTAMKGVATDGNFFIFNQSFLNFMSLPLLVTLHLERLKFRIKFRSL